MTDRPGGPPFMNRLPQSVIDRYEADQKAQRKTAGFTDVAQYWCEGSGAKPGEDNSTHHLVPRGPKGARSMTCAGCGKTEKDLRSQIDREN